MKTGQYLTSDDVEIELDQFDKSLWSFIGTGLSLSVLYFVYVGWVGVTTGQMVLVVPVDLQWTELVAVSPFLLVVSFVIGYFGRSVLVRTQGRTPQVPAEPEQSSD